VSPRRNRRERDDPSGARAPSGGGAERTETWPDGEWVVRPVAGAAATKTYRCPGCDQEIRPATAHVVAWPAESGGGLDDRRHWHGGCWEARARRTPRPGRASRR
jgi:hypothetical protein